MTKIYISSPTIKAYRVDDKIFSSIIALSDYMKIKPSIIRRCKKQNIECNGKRIREIMIDRKTINDILYH